MVIRLKKHRMHVKSLCWQSPWLASTGVMVQSAGQCADFATGSSEATLGKHIAGSGAARTAVSRRPTAFSSVPTSPTAGLLGISASMALWAGLLTAEGEGDGDSSGPPVPAGGAMSWHAAGRWTRSARESMTGDGARVAAESSTQDWPQSA